jgi:hypothetical protein
MIDKPLCATWPNDKMLTMQQQSNKDSFFIQRFLEECLIQELECKLNFLNKIKKLQAKICSFILHINTSRICASKTYPIVWDQLFITVINNS